MRIFTRTLLMIRISSGMKKSITAPEALSQLA